MKIVFCESRFDKRHSKHVTKGIQQKQMCPTLENVCKKKKQNKTVTNAVILN